MCRNRFPDAVVFESDGTPDYVATFCSYTYDGKDLQNLYSNFFCLLWPKLGFGQQRPSTRIQIDLYYDGKNLEAGSSFGITVGDNYTGCADLDVIEKLNDTFAKGVAPRWFLDQFDYRYRWWDTKLCDHAMNFHKAKRMPKAHPE
ncbi:hypothetical protein GYMLUDRAFT_251092 [Collybiopsis luxurians FD-317 M1]|uniref:Unplaced genomic scaffold GYMLUscaffold_92, whole genome shotgun sequence n=1 Tax=Collybiopsis luxurians FD-317 M1 TaxID=944289 RepID=A0A0D0AQJ3_9AGAR|nr:hypothetical protein GYMLUDRAFT_251092 [Collybiopsis luxurians FD-317 M1]